MSTRTRGGAPFHHGDLRNALIGTACELIERVGPAAISLREAARIAGVSHNAPYRHFPTREALLAAVAAEGFNRLRTKFEEALAPVPDDRLLAIGQAYLRFAIENPGIFRLMFGAGLNRQTYPELGLAAEQAFEVLTRRTSVSGEELPQEIALGAWSLVHGLSHLLVEDQLGTNLKEDALSGRLLDRLTQSFGRRSSAPSPAAPS